MSIRYDNSFGIFGSRGAGKPIIRYKENLAGPRYHITQELFLPAPPNLLLPPPYTT